jgi:hypothetical protein
MVGFPYFSLPPPALPPGPPAEDLLDAVRAALLADPDVAAVLGARIFLDRPPSNVVWPWAEFVEVSRPTLPTTGRASIETFDFQLNVYSHSRGSALRAAHAIDPAIDRQDFAFTSGVLMGVARRAAPRVVQEPVANKDVPGAAPAFTAYLSYRALVSRTRADRG